MFIYPASWEGEAIFFSYVVTPDVLSFKLSNALVTVYWNSFIFVRPRFRKSKNVRRW
jgi:hypothetical protein